MQLRGIEFGSVWGASGVQGFFGEGYPFHKFLRPFGLSFEGMTFVAKTTVLASRKGNMSLKKDGLTPRNWNPSCIKINFFEAAVLNSVGLSGPGALSLFLRHKWQTRVDPFFLSFASTALTKKGRLEELRQFIFLCREYFPSFRAQVGIQLNFTCPNTGKEEFFIGEIHEHLSVAAELDVPLVPKLSVLFPPEIVRDIAAHPECDAICISNTIPWGMYEESINWKGLFGSHKSPLAHIGGGGLSGKPIFPFVKKWVHGVNKIGLGKPICAGGGILSERDVDELVSLGVQAISLGSVAILRPWRVKSIIKHARKVMDCGNP